jgi:aconitate decarboxylase
MFANDHPTDVNSVAERLGEHWELMNILVKPYASGGTTHPTVDAVLRARNELGLRPDELAAMTIRLTHDSFHHNGWKLERPTTTIGAQLNVAYVAAVALIDGEVFVDQFSSDRIDADDVWSIIERTTVIHDEAVDDLAKRSGTPRATRVTVERQDGSIDEIEILEARGTRSLALSNEEIRTKFHGLVTGLVGAKRAQAIEQCTLSLSELEDAQELIDLLRGGVGVGR